MVDTLINSTLSVCVTIVTLVFGNNNNIMAAPLCWDLCQNLSFSSSSSRLCGDDGGDDDDDECPSLSPFSSHRLENIQDTPHRHN